MRNVVLFWFILRKKNSMLRLIVTRLYSAQGEEHGRCNYAALQRIWHREGMKSIRDWLERYNNLDVGPFLDALERHARVMRDFGLDLITDAPTLPGLALKFAMRDLPGLFHTFGEDQAHVHRLIRENLVGGPSIVFNR